MTTHTPITDGREEDDENEAVLESLGAELQPDGSYLVWLADDDNGEDGDVDDSPLDDALADLPQGWRAEWTGDSRSYESGPESCARLFPPRRSR